MFKNRQNPTPTQSHTPNLVPPPRRALNHSTSPPARWGAQFGTSGRPPPTTRPANHENTLEIQTTEARTVEEDCPPDLKRVLDVSQTVFVSPASNSGGENHFWCLGAADFGTGDGTPSDDVVVYPGCLRWCGVHRLMRWHPPWEVQILCL